MFQLKMDLVFVNSLKVLGVKLCFFLHCKLQAPLYWDVYANLGFNSARICFTCHNFEYQGVAPAQDLAYCGLDVDHLDRPDRMRDNSHGRINVVKVFTYGKCITGELKLEFSLMYH